MKLSARDAGSFLARPDLSLCGALLYGPDAVLTGDRCDRLVRKILGDEADNLRLTRMEAAEARKDPASISDEMRAQGFFPGRRVVRISDAGDGMAAAVGAALEDATAEDAFLILSAGVLPTRSKLRKLFEAARNAAAVPCYADAPSRGDLEQMLTETGAPAASSEAMQDLQNLAAELDFGALRQLVQHLATYKIGDESQITPQDIEACAPRSSDIAVDDALNAVANGDVRQVAQSLDRLSAQGAAPTSIAIAAARIFRQLHTVSVTASGQGGIDAALNKLRPPVFGPRRNAMAAQCRAWNTRRLEAALRMLTEVDLQLRSSQPGPAAAMLERTLIRIAMMRRN